MWTRQREREREEKFKSLKLNIIESIRPPPRSRWRWNNCSHFDFVFQLFPRFPFLFVVDSHGRLNERGEKYGRNCHFTFVVVDSKATAIFTKIDNVDQTDYCGMLDHGQLETTAKWTRRAILFFILQFDESLAVVLCFFRVALFLGSKNKLKICRKSISFFRFHRKWLH